VTQDMAFKKQVEKLLDQAGREHRSKHQGAYANRYIIHVMGGVPFEVMYEKGSRSPPNIWCLAKVSNHVSGVDCEIDFADRLWAKPGEYGRHSALEQMSQLANADLAKFLPKTLTDVRTIIDAIKSLSENSLKS
jgi:predicted unusual protein kinase regulating ubiquinone biosynthesis (AarF/ABC1/UbiB family)